MPPEAAKRRVLILGGTGEAAELARMLGERHATRLDITSSLAGRTERPGPIYGGVRIGGFGGTAGLAAYLRDQSIDLLIDATHPFADQISQHALDAATEIGVPRLCLIRPPWPRHPLDRWIEISDIEGAAAILPRAGRRAFLTLGSSEIAAFSDLPEMFFLVRTVDVPRRPLNLASHVVITGTGPFTVTAERALFEAHRIDVLVTKASGGAATEAKIIAARDLGLPVVMIRRPIPPAGERVATVAEAVSWIEATLGL